MSLEEQFLVFVITLGLGLLLGVVYDLYRVIDRRFRCPSWFTQVGDLAVWLVFAVIIFAALQYSNRGELRLFVFIGLGLGAAAYSYFLRRRSARGLYRLVDTTVKLAGWLFLTLSRPFKLAGRVLGLPLAWAAGVFGCLTHWLFRPFKALGRRAVYFFRPKISVD